MKGRILKMPIRKPQRELEFFLETLLFWSFKKQIWGYEMEKMPFLVLLIVFLLALVFAQEKVEAPIWNMGDKWVFDRERPMDHCM